MDENSTQSQPKHAVFQAAGMRPPGAKPKTVNKYAKVISNIIAVLLFVMLITGVIWYLMQTRGAASWQFLPGQESGRVVWSNIQAALLLV